MQKRTSPKSKNPSTLKAKVKKPVSLIDQLQDCIQSDLLKLGNAYEKSLASFDKSIARVVSALDKSKKKVNQVALNKKKSIDKATQSVGVSLEKELAILKAEKAHLANEYKKFLSQQKTIRLFEKEWAKNTKHIKNTKNRKPMLMTKTTKKTSQKSSSKIKRSSAVEPGSMKDQMTALK